MNWFVLVSAIVGVLCILAINVYILVYFQHPEDRNVAWFPKIVVYIGFTLSEITVLLLPLDVANRNDGILPMDYIWQVVTMAVAIMVFFVMPFAYFYYESEEEDKSFLRQLWEGLKIELIVLVIMALILGIMYGLAGSVELKTQRLVADLTYDYAPPLKCSNCMVETFYTSFRVTFPVYVIALVSLIGWFLFTLFAGIGLLAIPLEFFNKFRRRPKPIPLDEYARQKLVLHARAARLKEIGRGLQEEGLKVSRNRKDREAWNIYKQAVMFLDEDWKFLRTQYKERGGNPLLPPVWIFLGIVTLVIAVCWLLHILLYMFIKPPAAQFLNQYFRQLDDVFPLFGTLTYAIFAFYLLWAVIFGNMKFGLNFVIFTIHPMKVGETMMNAFLFNTLLIVYTSISVVHFCSQAFATYARSTGVFTLFTSQITHLKYIRYLWEYNIFLYSLFVLSILTFTYMIICPHRDRRLRDPEYLGKEMHKRNRRAAAG